MATTNTSPKKRIILLDTLRGFLLILVMLFHLLYDLHFIFGVDTVVMRYDGTYLFRDCFVSLLMIISGICCNLSHSNVRRGIKTFLLGMAISVVTYFFMPDEFILFGILHYFGVSMILYGLLEPLLKKINPYLGAAVCFVLFFVTFNLYDQSSAIRSTLLSNGVLKYIFFALGFNTGCGSADYYPVMPWTFMFLTGAFLGRNIKTMNLPKIFYTNCSRLLTWIGQRTIWLYLIHQPVMYGLLYCFFNFLYKN